MEEKNFCFYYIRGAENHPVATVCLLRKGNDIAKGISICAKIDSFDKNEGRERSFERAYVGILILSQADKPLTEKQIRLGQKNDNLGKKNKRYIALDKVKKPEALERLNASTAVYKTSTFPMSNLDEFEKTLVKKLGWI